MYDYVLIERIDFRGTTIILSATLPYSAPQTKTGLSPSQAINSDVVNPASQSESVFPETDKAQEKREIEAEAIKQNNTDHPEKPFHSEALEKLLEKVTQALEKELAPKEGTEEGKSQADENQIGGTQLKTLGLIIQKYAGKDLSFTEWSGLYQELQTEGFDISKPLLDVLL